MKKISFILLFICLSVVAYTQKYVQVWGDEFNTPGLPDSTKWDWEVGKLRNNELQYYTYKRSENARIQDTTLIIEARKEYYQGASYTSASLFSKFKGDWKYGKFEFSAKVPGGKGTWPAIWMMPTEDEYGGWPKSGEIDIMEYVGMNPNNLYFTTHYEGTNGMGHQSSGFNTSSISQPFNQFIKFTLYWTPSRLEWWANDKKFFTYTKPTNSTYKNWPFDKMFHLILNLAYGGDWGGQNGVDDSKLPHKFYIDYVRVYQLQATDGPFSLKVEPVNGGTVDVSPDQSSYPAETSVTLTAKPADDYVFEKWQDLGFSNPLKLKMISDKTILPVFKKKNELITNGEFSKGLQGWTSWFDAPTAPVFTTGALDSIFVANITKPGTANWHIVEQQLNIPLEQGATYSVSFEAWADKANTMDVFLSKNSGNYDTFYSTTKNITTTKQTFSWIQKMSKPSDANCRFGFGFGQFTGKVHIDNVSILKSVATKAETQIESRTGMEVFPNPVSGELKIVSKLGANTIATIKLVNLQGQIIATLGEKQLVSPGQTLNFTLNNSKISKGVYLLTISSPEQTTTQKVIVN